MKSEITNRIVLFANNINFITIGIVIKKYLKKHYKLNVVFFFDHDIFKITPDDIVIPIGLGACKVCRNLKIKNTLVNAEEMYNTLNLKSNCYVFTNNLGIKNIPTFPNFAYEPKKLDKFIKVNKGVSGKFLAKQICGAASTQLFTYNEYDLQKSYSKFVLTDYVIQPYLKIKKVITFDCVCYNGGIEDYIVEEKDTFYSADKFSKLNTNSWRRFITLEDRHVPQILTDTKMLVNHLNYNGFIELEYCVTESDELFFMEINPRICWVALTFVNNKSPYIDRLLITFANVCLRHKVYSSLRNEITVIPQIKSDDLIRDTDQQLSLVDGKNYQSIMNRIIIISVYLLIAILLYLLVCYIRE